MFNLKKTFLLLIVCCAIKSSVSDDWVSQEFIDMILPIVKKCETMTNVDKALVDKFSKGNLIDDPNLKCYMKCMFLEFEVMDAESGKIHYEKMLDALPESMKEIAYRMGKNCIHFNGENGEDLCQVSYDLHKCWQQADPEVSKDPYIYWYM